MNCNAIIEQGAHKGEQCWRPILNDGYCGKHQKQAKLKKELVDGRRKCSTHRCNNILDTDEKWCVECMNKKNSVVLPKCIVILEQSRNGKSQCENTASTGKYCKLHYERNTLLDDAKSRGVRICDDGKRACKNETQYMKLRCEECLEKARQKDNSEYKERKESGVCLNCGCQLEESIGFRRDVQRCEECYKKLRDTEKRRERTRRNYKKEYKTNINAYYTKYLVNAKKRNLEFTLSIEEFEEIINNSCYYCDYYAYDEVVGVDRLDSNIGYVIQNVVPCCSICNYSKGTLTLKQYITHCKKVVSNFEDISDSELEEESASKLNSYIRPAKILNLYNTNKLGEYIELCKKDGRSPLFIEKLEELSRTSDKTENEARIFIKNALQGETNMKSKSRVRISKAEMMGYLDNNNIDKCIEHYELAYGIVDGFSRDIHELYGSWKDYSVEDKIKKFNQVIIKYQNLRNRN